MDIPAENPSVIPLISRLSKQCQPEQVFVMTY
ncbi:hypothetical protein PTE_00660 [Photorhabdus khanii NC19]|uniref:Uncharacterized protein n=1 Tax=Photorhabdus khanii NC19 TaxID=1004151 RepID=W3VC43_9GAMM|nr:hypothetical protein PTE_00660 [Photorhabdus khanii NC19]